MLLPNDGDLFVVYIYICFCFELWHVLRHMLNDAQNNLLMYGSFQGDHLESIYFNRGNIIVNERISALARGVYLVNQVIE